jgi:hypothetical protein
MSRLAYYRDTLGFTRTQHIPFTRQYRIQCDCCASVVINGIPCHERGCPNATHECNGCNERIPVSRKYCDSCI